MRHDCCRDTFGEAGEGDGTSEEQLLLDRGTGVGGGNSTTGHRFERGRSGC